jgi:hypothetical protein
LGGRFKAQQLRQLMRRCLATITRDGQQADGIVVVASAGAFT